jgi:hypothetical protein
MFLRWGSVEAALDAVGLEAAGGGKVARKPAAGWPEPHPRPMTTRLNAEASTTRPRARAFIRKTMCRAYSRAWLATMDDLE